MSDTFDNTEGIVNHFCKKVDGNRVMPLKKQSILYNHVIGFNSFLASRSPLPTRKRNCLRGENSNEPEYSREIEFVWKEDSETLLMVSEKLDRSIQKDKFSNSHKKNVISTFRELYKFSVSIRKIYYYYVRFLFSEFDLDKLTEDLDMKCCNEEHNVNCERKWECLQSYLLFTFLRDLGLEPWKPLNHHRTSPSFLQSINIIRPQVICPKPSPEVISTLEKKQGKVNFVPICDPLWAIKPEANITNTSFSLFKENSD